MNMYLWKMRGGKTLTCWYYTPPGERTQGDDKSYSYSWRRLKISALRSSETLERWQLRPEERAGYRQAFLI